jgi:tripartite-type tricarboxylate transporter receptor subunit TctC
MTFNASKRTSLGLIAAALSVAAMGFSSVAQAAYPERPINMIVSYAPGGGTDLVARALAPYIEKHLGGARIVVVNRPGAGGEIGFAEVARATPDGYTIGFINTPNLLTIPIQRKAQYHWTDFDLIGNLIDDPDSFAINTKKFPEIKSLKDLEAYARANPGAVTVGTTGAGSDDHLAMLQFEKATGVKLLHVPYKGAGDVRTAVTSGEIMIAAMNIGEVLAYKSGGTPIEPFGVMAEETSSLIPELPTFKTQGYDIVMSSLRGIGAPKNLPEEVRVKLVDAVQKAANDPEFIEKAKAMFVPMRYLDPAAYKAELEMNEAMFKKTWDDSPWAE